MSAADIIVNGIENFDTNFSTELVENIIFMPGGDAVNESITISNFGHTVKLVTSVGNDAQGRNIIDLCHSNGVDVSFVNISKDYSTLTSIVLVANSGERSFISNKDSAADMYSLKNIDLSILEGVKIVSLASLFSSRSLANDHDLYTIVKKAKDCGAIVIADLVIGHEQYKLEHIKETLSQIDYIVPSLEEAIYFTGENDLSKIVSVFKSYGVKNVILKLGENGIYTENESDKLHFPTFASKVVDTTGAGDNFMAGFISGLIRELSLYQSIEFGTATSAISIGNIGATGAIHSIDQVEKYIEEARYKKN